MWVTFWKDGTWKVWTQADAYYARGDADWLKDQPFVSDTDCENIAGQTLAGS